MAELGSGLRAYVAVRRSAGDPKPHIAKGKAFAVCAAHVEEFAKLILGPPLVSPKDIDASIRLVANRPDVDAELQAVEIAGKGRSTCVVCCGVPSWQPKGKLVTMADLADASPRAKA